jgi:hypothetical protein
LTFAKYLINIKKWIIEKYLNLNPKNTKVTVSSPNLVCPKGVYFFASTMTGNFPTRKSLNNSSPTKNIRMKDREEGKSTSPKEKRCAPLTIPTKYITPF